MALIAAHISARPVARRTCVYQTRLNVVAYAGIALGQGRVSLTWSLAASCFLAEARFGI